MMYAYQKELRILKRSFLKCVQNTRNGGDPMYIEILSKYERWAE